MEEYRLSVAFCAVDESELLRSSYLKLLSFNFADEYIFMLSKTCTKECLKEVKSICASNNKCFYYYQSANGLGNAIQSVFRVAKGTHLLIWPADDGMDTSSFPKMISLSKKNPGSIVKVSRWLPGGGFENYGTLRKLINYFSQKIFAKLLSSDLTDFTNALQVAPIKIYQTIDWKRQDATFILEMIIKPLQNGIKIFEIPCKNVDKRENQSHIHLFTLVKYYFLILKYAFSKH